MSYCWSKGFGLVPGCLTWCWCKDSAHISSPWSLLKLWVKLCSWESNQESVIILHICQTLSINPTCWLRPLIGRWTYFYTFLDSGRFTLGLELLVHCCFSKPSLLSICESCIYLCHVFVVSPLKSVHVKVNPSVIFVFLGWTDQSFDE